MKGFVGFFLHTVIIFTSDGIFLWERSPTCISKIHCIDNSDPSGSFKYHYNWFSLFICWIEFVSFGQHKKSDF